MSIWRSLMVQISLLLFSRVVCVCSFSCDPFWFCLSVKTFSVPAFSQPFPFHCVICYSTLCNTQNTNCCKSDMMCRKSVVWAINGCDIWITEEHLVENMLRKDVKSGNSRWVLRTIAGITPHTNNQNISSVHNEEIEKCVYILPARQQ